MTIPPTIAGFGRRRKTGCEDRDNSLGPGRLSRIGSSEDFDESGRWIFEAHDRIEMIVQCEGLGKVAVSPIAVAEAERPASSEIAQPDIGESDPREGVEEIELLERRQIAFDDAMRQ